MHDKVSNSIFFHGESAVFPTRVLKVGRLLFCCLRHCTGHQRDSSQGRSRAPHGRRRRHDGGWSTICCCHAAQQQQQEHGPSCLHGTPTAAAERGPHRQQAGTLSVGFVLVSHDSYHHTCVRCKTIRLSRWLSTLPSPSATHTTQLSILQWTPRNPLRLKLAP